MMESKEPANQAAGSGPAPDGRHKSTGAESLTARDIIGLLAILSPLIASLLTSRISITIFIFILAAGAVSVWISLRRWVSTRTLILIWLIVVILILSLILFLPALISPRMTVTGVVVDQAGTPISGQMVTITDSFSTPHETLTDKEGKYAIAGVPKGTFTLKINDIEVSGKPVEILGQEVLLNFTLPSLTATPISTNTPLPSKTPTTAPIIIPSSTSPVAEACPFQGKDDNETIKQLIDAEATATTDKAMDTIRVIFSEDAVIVDNAANPGLNIWKNPTERYQDDLFQNTDFKGVVHFDILPAGQGITGDSAWFTSGSQGFYKTKSGSDWTYFFNGSQLPPNATQFGSEHWILKKLKGCWVITRLEFDSGHVPFPNP